MVGACVAAMARGRVVEAVRVQHAGCGQRSHQ